MAQHDYSIANQGFPATRADINNVLSAIATNNSGTSAPSTQYAGQFWIDTTSSTWTLYIHDGADDIQFATIDTSSNTVNFIDSELGDNSVTTAKIADGNVTSAKLSYPLTTFSSTGIDDNATSTAITIDSSENVGIGTSSPASTLEISKNDRDNGCTLSITNSHSSTSWEAGDIVGTINFRSDDPNATEPIRGQIVVFDDSSGASSAAPNKCAMKFSTALNYTLSERMRIESSGNLLIGTTDNNPSNNTSGGDNGISFVNGQIRGAKSGNAVMDINRMDSIGDIAYFRYDGTTRGFIGNNNASNGLEIVGGSAGLAFVATLVVPVNGSGNYVDNTLDLGTVSYRFDDIFATNGTIQTSDQNEKQSIQSLTTAEMNVAKRLSPLIKTFKWNSAVEEKGDNARTHTGIIAQDVQQAFTDEGLDAGNYALFISDTWWEKEISVDAVAEEVDENGNVITEAKDAYTYMDNKEEATDGYTERTRLGVRYPELLSFIQAYNDQRFTELEARITALETAN